MITPTEVLDAIRYLADQCGMPDGLESEFGHYWLIIVQDPTVKPKVIVEDDIHGPLFWIWLAAFLAHAEAWAEKELGVNIGSYSPHRARGRNAFWFRLESSMGEQHGFDLGDTRSRLVARLLTLVDGVRAVKGEEG